ncbi:cell division protein PerM [Nocardia arthritidis]|uniref:Uncharacterized protein n=1 Tax=Nocardia arthritidis TaxID=228602 RepID=A0A6G9YRR3_9NOCA|nr:DUF6350 family protein [Nocardia arthritidis]QIS15851.1 hypothetical protein F5544_40175 [Nocardia arthritidis]
MSSPRNSLVRRAAEPHRDPDPGRGGRGAEADEAGFLSLTPERAKVLLLVAARPAAYALIVITVLVLVTLLTSGGGMAGVSGAIAASWLAAHQVPLVIGKTTLGLLPLFATALLLWLVARECAAAVEPGASRADLGWIVGAALGGPLLITAVCLAVAEDASGVIALQPPHTLVAFGWVAGLHLVAAAAGIAGRSKPELIALVRPPEWVIAAIFAAGRTAARLLACATAITVLSFLVHWSRIGETYRGAGNAAGVIGLSVLSLAYLPNVVLLATGVLVGAGAQFGAASVGLFDVVGGPIPAVPVLAAVPEGPAAGWWVVLLVAPVAVGVLGGLDCGRTSQDRATAPWATLTSAALAALLLTVLAAIAGGELGNFGHIGVELPLFVMLTFALLAVPGYLGLLFARWFVVPVESPYVADSYEYADDDYDDDYERDDYDDDRDYPEDDYDDDPYYDDERYTDYDGPDLHVEVDGELVEEQTAIGATKSADDAHDIVDAEVVESDLPSGDHKA